MKNENNEVFLTKEGLKSLQDELNDLVKVQRPKILGDLNAARALGDLSENGMYTAAKDKQSFLEGRIREIESILKNAVVVEKASVKKGTIDLGSHVTLETQQAKVNYSIVGVEEVNFSENKISHESPLGKALIGKSAGDMIEVEAPMGTVKYKVLEVK